MNAADEREWTCCAGGHPEGWRRIEVDPFADHARNAAKVLVLLGAADEVYPSYLVPHPAIWSLNGEPMIPEAAS